MSVEKHLDTVERYIHNERLASDVKRALNDIEDHLQENNSDLPDEFIELDQAILGIIENSHSLYRDDYAQHKLDLLRQVIN